MFNLRRGLPIEVTDENGRMNTDLDSINNSVSIIRAKYANSPSKKSSHPVIKPKKVVTVEPKVMNIVEQNPQTKKPSKLKLFKQNDTLSMKRESDFGLNHEASFDQFKLYNEENLFGENKHEINIATPQIGSKSRRDSVLTSDLGPKEDDETNDRELVLSNNEMDRTHEDDLISPP